MQKPIPDVYKYYIDKYIMDAASLDSKIFLKMMQAYDALLEIKHVRSGVINYIQPFDENNADIVQGFVEYAIEEIDDVYESISGLYRECVGKQLDVHRYR